jgi:hypothetical protein
MLEHHKEKLIGKKEFLSRQIKYIGFSMIILACSLGIGTAGYHIYGKLAWIDALLNASMILTGMGPGDHLDTDGTKLFAAFYALFSGVAFLSFVGVLFAPIYDWFLHRFHFIWMMIIRRINKTRPSFNTRK